MTKITCTKYTKQIGETKRCMHFVQGGACALPDELMCSEWLKVNEQKPQEQPKQEKSQIFGFLGDIVNPCLVPTGSNRPAYAAPQASQGGPASPVGPSSPHGSERAPGRPEDAAWAARAYGEQQAKELRDIPLESMSLEAVESLTNLKIDTLINSNSDLGEIWLTPEYTEQKRSELTYRDARFLMLVVKIFPGSTIKAIRRPE